MSTLADHLPTTSETLRNLQTIFTTVTDGIVLQTHDGQIVECNPAADRILGLTAAQMLGLTSTDPTWQALREDGSLFPGDEHPAMVALRTATPQHGVVMGVQRPDGVRAWISIDATPIIEHGQAVRVVSVFTDITARRAAEEEAEHLRALTSSVVESTLDAVVSIDDRGVVAGWNRRATELFMYEREEALGQNMETLIVPERYRAAHRAGLARFLSSGEGRLIGTRVEIDALRKDGQEIPVELALSTAMVGGRSVFNAFIRDMSHERMRDAEVARTRRLLASIRETQATFIAGEATASVFTRLLDSLLTLTESEHGFIGEVCRRKDGTPYLKTHAITNIAWDEQSRAFYESHAPAGLEFTNLNSLFGRTIATGETVIANSPASDPRRGGTPPGHPPLRAFLGLPLEANGQLIGMVGIANRPGGYDEHVEQHLRPVLATCGQVIEAVRRERDRVTMETALRESEQRLRLVLDATGIGRWDWNPQTDEAVFDERWAGLVGYRTDEIQHTGAQWVQLVNADDLARLMPVLEAHLRGDTPSYSVEFRMRHKDGRWVWMLALGQVVERNAQGAPLRVVGVHVDISTQKETEAALAQARDAAERASRAKSQFLANMSHEIRTPMNGVVGIAHLLLATNLDDEQREFAETMMRSGEVLLSLIDDVLDFSRIEAGHLTVEHIAIDLREVLADSLSVVAPKADEKGLDLLVEWKCPPLAQMVGDAKRVRQVLLNLLSNAVKFSGVGAVVVCVEQARAGVLRLSVTDRGIGIEPEKQAAIFEQFVQADSSTTRRFGGSGLGLAISRRLVEAMGGEIGVESSPGHGSTFWFTLPTGHARVANTDAATLGRLSAARVMLVGSAAQLLDNVRQMLEGAGAHTEVAASVAVVESRLAEAAAQGQAFDLLLCDAGRASGEGLASLRALVALADRHACAALVLAPAAQRHELRGHLSGHRVHLVGKPVLKMEHLLDGAAHALDRRASPIGLATEPALPQDLDRRAPSDAPVVTRRRVLLAEDNDVNRLVATRMLHRCGCDVQVASDGRAAVAMAARARFDLIFMDCDMPDMDGYEATAAIRSATAPTNPEATPPDVPIIALTANALAGDRERCLAAGMNDYIAKPMVPSALADVLDRWSRGLPEPHEATDVMAAS